MKQTDPAATPIPASETARDVFGAKQFRGALGRFATGVTVITTMSTERVPVGMTCNSFAALSLEPPLIQWALAKSSRNYRPFTTSPHFAVHVLTAEQGPLCKQFSILEGDRFQGVALEYGPEGVPLLRQYHARFECELHSRCDAGDHTILMGRVLRFQEQDGAPLIFYRSGLASLTI